MDFKVSKIDIGCDYKWPTVVLLGTLTNDCELGETEWWRRMAILQNAAAQTSDNMLLQKLDEAKMEKYGSCFPMQEVTTPNNVCQANNLDDTKYFAPMKNLQMLLSNTWFDQVSTSKNLYSPAYRNQMILDLMQSDYRDYIAAEWTKQEHRLQIKGRILGALMAAGVLKKNALAIARLYYNTGGQNTKEVKTLAKYMGDHYKENYSQWVIDYVKNG